MFCQSVSLPLIAWHVYQILGFALNLAVFSFECVKVCVSPPPSVSEGDSACQCLLLLCSCRTSLGAISWAQCTTVRVRLLFSHFSSLCTLLSASFPFSLANCPSSSLTSFILIWFLTLSTYLSLFPLPKTSPALTCSFSSLSIFAHFCSVFFFSLTSMTL